MLRFDQYAGIARMEARRKELLSGLTELDKEFVRLGGLCMAVNEEKEVMQAELEEVYTKLRARHDDWMTVRNKK